MGSEPCYYYYYFYTTNIAADDLLLLQLLLLLVLLPRLLLLLLLLQACLAPQHNILSIPVRRWMRLLVHCSRWMGTHLRGVRWCAPETAMRLADRSQSSATIT